MEGLQKVPVYVNYKAINCHVTVQWSKQSGNDFYDSELLLKLESLQ